MKKQILIALFLLIVSVFSAVSCDETPAAGGAGHTHTYTDAFTSNKTHHWHQATCEHGESKKDYTEHIDANADGNCDDCEYTMGHEHTFPDEWQTDETGHWKNAVCHPDVKGFESSHADNNTDGKCDTCDMHMHIVNLYGACEICGTQVNPVKDGELASAINAILGRSDYVTGGSVKYSYTGVNKTDGRTDKNEHIAEFLIGANGTYTKMTEKDADSQTVVTENWIKIMGNKVSGLKIETINGNKGDPIPGSYAVDDLGGYYYTISSIADGYTAEEILAVVFGLSSLKGAENFAIVHTDGENKYSFSFDYLELNKFDVGVRDDEGNPTGEIKTVYKVHYYNIKVEFSYTADYDLIDLKIICDCYTDDPGQGDGASYEADVDLDYDPATGKCTIRDGAGADTYFYTVTQTHGTRVNIDLGDADKYIPTDFDFYSDYALTTKIEGTITLNSEQNFFVNIGCTPEDANIDFIIDGAKLSVKNASGEEVFGFAEFFSGAVFITPTVTGEYTITVTSGNLEKSLTVIVTEE